MIEKIISGGQSGVDTAALDIASKMNISHGGWCPKGRLMELNGVIPEKYSLIETTSSDFSERTKLNIRDSDGTLIIVPSLPINVNDGTILTIEEVKLRKKPFFIVDLSATQDFKKISAWAKQHNIKILNIAGPRESQSPGIFQRSYEFLQQLLPKMQKELKDSENTTSEQTTNFKSKL